MSPKIQGKNPPTGMAIRAVKKADEGYRREPQDNLVPH